MKKLIYLFLTIVFICQYTIAQVPSYVPTDGLVGYWPFDGNANDASGNGNNGVVNGPTLTSDRFGNNNSAYSFTVNSSAGWGSAQDRITVTNPTIPNDNSFTMSGWVNLETKPSPYNDRSHSLMGRWDDNQTIIFRNQINYSGQILTILADDGLNLSIYSSGNVTYGNWEHVVITYDGSVLKHYKNGQLTGQETLNININTSTASLTFGEINMSNGHWYLFSGKMDDLGYWSRPLTQEEITTLYETEVLSTNTATYESNINIYPNPANDHITIDFGNLDNVEDWNIKIINILGQEVLSQPMDTDKINVSELSKGVYIIRISDGVNKADKKFIKN
ncbi:T9SS type A sorting domain-containing protein [Flavobacteriaceae bacterium]|nr:T9SS type A sorting domain-containing protein [Flavobacteriaceae bacterium]